jgi:endonuclease/exonuclease/phosphatase family metal-dependent hydrolase
MWDISIFEVSSIEFGGQWINLCDKHVNSFFNCMVIGVYVASSMQDRAKLWEDITTPKFASKLPMVVIGDFNEPLHAHERSSIYFNHLRSTSLRNFLSNCDLIEFKLQSHHFTWFRGGSMSRIDRAFASPEFHLQFHSYHSTATLEGCLIIVNYFFRHQRKIGDGSLSAS